MIHKPYLLLSAVIFGLVGIMHLLRAINGWVFQINTWMMPVSISSRRWRSSSSSAAVNGASDDICFTKFAFAHLQNPFESGFEF